MKTIGQVLKLATQYLQEKNCTQGRLEVEHLIAHTLDLKRLDLYLRFDVPLTEKELEAIRVKLARLAKGEPLAYIEGSCFFHALELNVDKRVLIPRPETELLVDLVIKKVKSGALWDICTGSGCIGLAIKKACPDVLVTLSDLSPDALDVARQNAENLQVEIVQGDLLEPFKGRKADYIVCNPPYISTQDFAKLDTHVKDFEPKMALTSGKTGYEMYERLSQELPNYLNPGATVWLEVGAGQAEYVKKLFYGYNVLSYKDYSGHERIIEINSA